MLEFLKILALAIGVLVGISIAGLLLLRIGYALSPRLRRNLAAFRLFAEREGGKYERFGIDGSPRVEIDRPVGTLVVQFERRNKTSHTDIKLRGHGAAIGGSYKLRLDRDEPGDPLTALTRARADLKHLAAKTKLWNTNVLDAPVPKIWLGPDEVGVSVRSWLEIATFGDTVRFVEERLIALAHEVAALERAAPAEPDDEDHED